MDITTFLDVDVVALEATDSITVMLELAAPEAVADTERLASCVVVVLDRSGSMSGQRLAAAKSGLLGLVDRLRGDDRLGVVVFDTTAELVVPAEPIDVIGRDRLREEIRRIDVGGNTDIGAGLLRGLQEAKRVASSNGATLILLSDGEANTGLTDPQRLSDIAQGARAQSISTSTVGIGLGYDERIMSAVATGGAGNATFAEHADGAAAAIAGEVDGLLSKTVQNATLLIKPGSNVAAVSLLNDVPSVGLPDGISADLGDFYAGERRRIVVQVDVPGLSALGLATIAELEIRYVELPTVIEHRVTVPINVNVVPGDEAAGRVPRPEVVQERLLLEAQKAKQESEDLMRRGDYDAARQTLLSASAQMRPMAAMFSDVAEEVDWMETTAKGMAEWDEAYTTKRLNISYNKGSSGKRLRKQGGEVDDQN